MIGAFRSVFCWSNVCTCVDVGQSVVCAVDKSFVRCGKL